MSALNRVRWIPRVPRRLAAIGSLFRLRLGLLLGAAGTLAVVGVAGIVAMAPSRAFAAPEVDLHDLDWYVHVDLIEPGQGRDLAYWQGVIDDALAKSNQLLEGRQGPVDQACCARLTASTPVTTFGSPGDGLDVIDTQTEQNLLAGLASGTGSRAFLVDSTTYCSGFSPGSIGCAVLPGCSGNPSDDPDLWMYVTVDAFDQGTLSSVIAHERGHNACLTHIASAPCELMGATVFTPGLGACLSTGECNNYRAARTVNGSGIECSCHDDSSGILSDGAFCAEAAGGVCSGGLCGEFGGDAAVRLLTAAAPGDFGGAPEDALAVSGLSGDWTNLGQISPSADDVRAMAYAHDSGVLFGVVPTVADDRIITMDATTGAVINAAAGILANGSDEIVSMAYDPGDSPAASDDRLIVLEVQGDFGRFLSIDPASPSSTTLLGGITIGPAANFSGMAYDSLQGRLFLASPFGPSGFFEVDLDACTTFSCPTAGLPWSVRAWQNASLGFSRETGKLYLLGTQSYGLTDTTFYAVIDPTTGVSDEALSLDRFTPSALAVVPEPGFVTGITASLLALTLTARRRRNTRA